MNKKELKEKLIKNNVPPDLYCLDGGLPNESYCLDINDKWEIYYSERGNKNMIYTSSSEEDACTYFYELISTSSPL